MLSWRPRLGRSRMRLRRGFGTGRCGPEGMSGSQTASADRPICAARTPRCTAQGTPLPSSGNCDSDTRRHSQLMMRNRGGVCDLGQQDTEFVSAQVVGVLRYRLLGEHAARRHQLEVDLRRGLRANQLRLMFQPYHELTSGNAAGYEARGPLEAPTRRTAYPGKLSPACRGHRTDRSGRSMGTG